MNNWTTYALGDLGRIVTGRTPPSSEPEHFEGTIPFITPSDIDGENRSITTERGISAQWDTQQSRISLPPKAVCVVCIGATIGKVCFTNAHSQSNQQINSIIVDETRFDPLFVYYRVRLLRDELKQRAAGAATPILNKTAFSQVEVKMPPLHLQRRIASILGAHDDLIEVNRRRISLLEEMARRLFEEWFVRFLFPGHKEIVQTPEGSLPEGWTLLKIGDAFEIVGGGTPSKTEPSYWEGGTINWYTPSDLTGSKTMFMDASTLQITPEGLRRSSAQLFPAYSVMMTSRATIGAISINTTEACTNQGFITCIPNERVPLSFLLHWLHANVPVFVAHATGSTFKEIIKSTFRRLPIVLPHERLLTKYEALTRPIIDLVLRLERAQRVLSSARDLLLPRLISGELSVFSSEPKLEAAE
jgi:type I restriction enzyme S subunit